LKPYIFFLEKYASGFFIGRSLKQISRPSQRCSLNPRSIGSAGRLPIADVITEFLNYPESGFLVNFRMTPESFWALVELLESRGCDDHWHQNSGGAGGGGPGRPAFQQIAIALFFVRVNLLAS